MDTKNQIRDNITTTNQFTLNVEDIPTPPSPPTTNPVLPNRAKNLKGVEKAKQKLRAFSIQKKISVPPMPTLPVKPLAAGSNTVVIGKLSSVKVTPKPPLTGDEEQKKPLKPPKPGTTKKYFQETYSELQKKTLSEIEDMKRKMELVDLGIPLGLICPAPDSDKAMPTKAMPPIKTFLEPAKVDELIREAKKARAEGREFKFDYNKLLPDYDNPFQRKKDEPVYAQDKDRKIDKLELRSTDYDKGKDRKSDRHDSRRYSSHRRDSKDRYKDRNRSRDARTRSREIKHPKDKTGGNPEGEANVNLNDYLVCDSWSLDNDEKCISSPQVINDKAPKAVETAHKDNETVKQISKDQSVSKIQDLHNNEYLHKNQSGNITPKIMSPLLRPIKKLEKLHPVIDSFEYEIDPNEETLNIIEDTKKKKSSKAVGDNAYVLNAARESSFEDVNDDTFLESVINEIKQEDFSDEFSQDKGLVEYDDSPKDDEISLRESQGSVTPELNDSVRAQSQRSDYSDGYRSTESGYKSTEGSYKSPGSDCKLPGSLHKSIDSIRSSDSYQLSGGKASEGMYDRNMANTTMQALETWSVLKICQPLLFRHDKNNCYKETHCYPKLWYTENPKICDCVEDRAIIYEELEMCKPDIVDRIYEQFHSKEEPSQTSRTWYPHMNLSLTENCMVQISAEWEMEDSQTEHEPNGPKRKEARGTLTPQRSEELSLDREYQRFMDAVWPEMTDPMKETSRSTTPVQETRKKKITEGDKNPEENKKSKKMKLSSEAWSQESDMQDEGDKSTKKTKTVKIKKALKRRRSTSTLSTDTDADEVVKKKKKTDKKVNKKLKMKSLKERRIEKKRLRKLKAKEKKKKKHIKVEKIDDSDDEEEIKKKDRKKLKKKKQQKLKKKIQKKRARKSTSSSDSESSSSESSSETDSEEEKIKKSKKKDAEVKKKRKQKKKKCKQSADSNEELFDVNILKNIKTERLTDDEKNQKKLTDQDFSPRRQQKKNQEIINVKELQDDFVVNNRHIKQEKDDSVEKTTDSQSETMSDVVISDTVTETPSEDKSNDSEIQIEEPSKNKDGTIIKENEKHKEDIKNEFQIKDARASPSKMEHLEFKEPQEITTCQEKNVTEESNLSQCSSQESVISLKDMPIYEKDDSHLRPSSQNSNYSFNDVINASQSGLYQKEKESNMVCEEKFIDSSYEPHNYEMYEYEQMAMAYQNDSVNQVYTSAPVMEHRIETVVGSRNRGEIKCDWRPGDTPASLNPQRPSRWGLKPGQVNIVLTGGGNTERYPIRSVAEPVYRIESIANRNDANIGNGYDEAYMDMYGASDKLQYGDCFATNHSESSFMSDCHNANFAEYTTSGLTDETVRRVESIISNTVDSLNIDRIDSSTIKKPGRSSLEERIDHALRQSALGEVATEPESDSLDSDVPEKGILIITKKRYSGNKRVSFADGYQPGQDSDKEDPPAKKYTRNRYNKKKKKKARRMGCAWPCPTEHPDHVPLWDALPPPPPPPGSPPPPASRGPPAHLLRRLPPPSLMHMAPHPRPHPLMQKYDPNTVLPNMLRPEQLSGLMGYPDAYAV